MELRLNDDEIREVLADALSKKVDRSVYPIPPEDCWFECEAGEINQDGSVGDINNVKFCYSTTD